jgi:hypothetical protein
LQRIIEIKSNNLLRQNQKNKIENKTFIDWTFEHSKELKKITSDFENVHCYGNLNNTIDLSQFVLCLESVSFMVYGRNDQNKNIELNLLKDTASMRNIEKKGNVKAQGQGTKFFLLVLPLRFLMTWAKTYKSNALITKKKLKISRLPKNYLSNPIS